MHLAGKGWEAVVVTSQQTYGDGAAELSKATTFARWRALLHAIARAS